MYVYIYIYIYIHINTYIHMCIYVYIYIYIYTHTQQSLSPGGSGPRGLSKPCEREAGVTWAPWARTCGQMCCDTVVA